MRARGILALALAAATASSGAAADNFIRDVQFSAKEESSAVLCVPKAKAGPVLDGKLDDPAWAAAARIDGLTGCEGETPAARTVVRVCRDAETLYIAFECQEPAMDDLVLPKSPDEGNWPGDVVEVFAEPGKRGRSFYHFITNSQGVHHDYGPGQKKEWNGAWTVKTGRREQGWTAELAIPFKDLGATPGDGGMWGFNVARERNYRKGKVRALELSTWAPTGQSFSSPDRFGTLFFGTAEQYEARSPGILLNAVIDRSVYTTRNRTAQIGAEFRNGRAAGSTLTVALGKANEKTPLREATIKELKGERIGVDISLDGLAAGEYEARVVATNAQGRASNSVTLPFRIEAAAVPPATAGQVLLRQTEPVGQSVPLWHVRTGVPFPEGALDSAENAAVYVGEVNVPAQVTSLATWSKGGSVKWIGLDFQTPLKAGVAAEFTVRYGAKAGRPAQGRLSVKEDGESVRIDTGAARFQLRKKRFNLIDVMWIGDRQVVSSGEERGPYMADEAGQRFWGSQDGESVVTVEESGPLMAVVKAEGAHRNGKATLGRYVMHLYFYSGLEYFRVQHTFIIAEDTRKARYSDIGVAYPFAGTEYCFGVPGTEGGSGAGGRVEGKLDGRTVSLLQRTWENFVVQRNAAGPNAAAERLHEKDKAAGWFGRPGFAVLVKDLWRNYPKELEATPEGLVVHMWPGHGEAAEPDRKPTPKNVWRLWFVHEGKLLDFNFPESYFTPEMKKEYGWDTAPNNSYGPPARNTNAMGVGKTHDMLVAFGSQASPAAASALNEAFQRGVHVLADPKWICASDAAGPMQPRDVERFPIPEDYYSSGFDYLMRVTLELNKAYGMFNYGDSFSMNRTNSAGQEPLYYRLWAGYHHGRARVPWLLYMRSGDPKYLRWGLANSLHLADVDTCHFATEEFASTSNASARKAVGGLCDYKGTVHWHTGARVDYNSMVDFLLYNYYLTGDRRMWDVFQEVGRHTVAKGHVAPERHGAGVLSTMLDYYKATWDARALFRLKSLWPQMYATPAWEHSPRSIGWAPYMEPFIDLTGDADAKKFLLEFADWRYSDKVPVRGMSQYGGDGRALAEAYGLTGDEKYLLSGWAAANLGPSLYRKAGDPLTGYVNWYPYSYITQNTVYLLRPMAQRKQPPSMAEVPYWSQSSGARSSFSHVSPNSMVVLLPEKTDTAFKVNVRFGAYDAVQYRFIAPDGSVIREATLPRQDNSKYFTLEQPADGKTGVYRVELSSPKPFDFLWSDICTLGTARFAVPEDKKLGITTGDNVRWYFLVPAECEEFAISLVGCADPRERTVAEVFTPEDRPWQRLDLSNGEAGVLKVTPPRAQRGKVWCLSASNATIMDVQGIARWFAGKPDGASADLPR